MSDPSQATVENDVGSELSFPDSTDEAMKEAGLENWKDVQTDDEASESAEDVANPGTIILAFYVIRDKALYVTLEIWREIPDLRTFEPSNLRIPENLECMSSY